MQQLLHTYGKLVCKPNEGSGGSNVFLVENQTDLEKAVHKVFTCSRSLAIAPFYEIENEYRVVLLKNKVKLIFSKKQPFIVGNGRSTVLQLLTKKFKQVNISGLHESLNLNYVPAKTEVLKLNWKHNLGLGSVPEIINDSKLTKKLSALAKQTAGLLNVKFCSVDIAAANNDLKVLEINSGVMMEHFSRTSAEYYKIAKDVYKDAIIEMFK